MSQVAFIIDVPSLPAAALGDFPNVGEQLRQLVSKDFPSDNCRFVSSTTSDTKLTVGKITDVVNPTNANVQLHRVNQAGGAAGSTAVTGAVATSVILAVFSAAQANGALADVTAEWVLVAHPPTAGHFNNTGGTNNTTNNMVFVFYNPPTQGAGA
jgi:hypothetical protein